MGTAGAAVCCNSGSIRAQRGERHQHCPHSTCTEVPASHPHCSQCAFASLICIAASSFNQSREEKASQRTRYGCRRCWSPSSTWNLHPPGTFVHLEWNLQELQKLQEVAGAAVDLQEPGWSPGFHCWETLSRTPKSDYI